MKDTMRNVFKLAGAVTVATGVVVLSAVVASGVAVNTVAEGFKSAKSTAKTILAKKEEAHAEAVESEQ